MKRFEFDDNRVTHRKSGEIILCHNKILFEVNLKMLCLVWDTPPLLIFFFEGGGGDEFNDKKFNLTIGMLKKTMKVK